MSLQAPAALVARRRRVRRRPRLPPPPTRQPGPVRPHRQSSEAPTQRTAPTSRPCRPWQRCEATAPLPGGAAPVQLAAPVAVLAGGAAVAAVLALPRLPRALPRPRPPPRPLRRTAQRRCRPAPAVRVQPVRAGLQTLARVLCSVCTSSCARSTSSASNGSRLRLLVRASQVTMLTRPSRRRFGRSPRPHHCSSGSVPHATDGATSACCLGPPCHVTATLRAPHTWLAAHTQAPSMLAPLRVSTSPLSGCGRGRVAKRPRQPAFRPTLARSVTSPTAATAPTNQRRRHSCPTIALSAHQRGRRRLGAGASQRPRRSAAGARGR
jgi:hypothetical protein